MENNIEPEGVEEITFNKGKIRIADGNKVKEFIVKVHKYVTLQPLTKQNITDPLYIEPQNAEENSSESEHGTKLTASTVQPSTVVVEPSKKNYKQYLPKHRRNDNVEQHQQQLKILRQCGLKGTKNKNLEMRLPQKDNMRQNVPKYRILWPAKETVEKRQENVHGTQQDVAIDTPNESENCLEKPQGKLNTVSKRIDLKHDLVKKTQYISNRIVNESVEEFDCSLKKEHLPKSKCNDTKCIKTTEIPKDRQFHINFSPGVSGEKRKRLLKEINKYSWKHREKELVKNASWYKVTIQNRERKFQISEPEQNSERVDQDVHTDDTVEHPAQSVKKKYQIH